MSLGGIGEIGANCYLYCCDGKWIMIDLGLSFADEKYPGVDLLVPKLDFLDKISVDLEAIIISHGHEDHAGAVAFLTDKIHCPVYATGFAKTLIENRLKEFGKSDTINLISIDPKKNIKLNNFIIKFISTTHSIPEPYSIIIDTKYGKLLHTADWKIESNPLLGEKFDTQSFKDLGNEGLLALIGDSTNADIPGFSKSEIDQSKKTQNKSNYFSKRFAAKEAFMKALGTGFRYNVNFKDISVINNKEGKPELKITNNIKKLLINRLKVKKFNLFISLSDEKNYSIAFVIIQKNK